MLFLWCFYSAGIHFVESLNLQTKMSWSKEFSSSGLQWTCRSAGGTSVISGGCYLALSSWMGILLVSRSGVPSGKQCLISILSCFQVFFLFFFCLCSWSGMPSTNTDALTLVATLVCHDLVYFCSQWVAFMTLYVFLLHLPLFYLNMNMRASLSYSTQRSCNCSCSCTPPTSSPDYQLCCC